MAEKLPSRGPKFGDTVGKTLDLARAAVLCYFLLRLKYQKEEIREKLDKFFDATVIAEVKELTEPDQSCARSNLIWPTLFGTPTS
jgi:hypothetical protein